MGINNQDLAMVQPIVKDCKEVFWALWWLNNGICGKIALEDLQEMGRYSNVFIPSSLFKFTWFISCSISWKQDSVSAVV